MKPSVQVNIYQILINFLFYKTWNKEVTFPLIFNFASEHVIWLGHENKQGLAAKGPRQFLVNAYDVNLLGENTHSIKAIKSFISVQM
jgi:hypothetical protein